MLLEECGIIGADRDTVWADPKNTNENKEASMQKGFFGALFDMSFSEFITTKLIKVLYILLLIVLVLGYLGLLISGFSSSLGVGLLMMFIVGPIAVLLYLIMIRVYLELIMVLFRIEENTRK
jgi:hypothetical protein